ncbi:type I restriction enzyme HsdR N-terminal domain-containing protein [Peptostreptococcus equinus]|uniref:Type I restriction enzyme HsdR N-terminal domain-containing protein n=1 Tax=Peptostreptococcus equinus TaxID=3003601 RepID=A0ABY7JU65_9FIRM|nr:type I restriction enzyme HsdR N-terminal domain-containing protein [Peptostreptococcus sp. CBA3647]WAW15698.1 type I restriction enzyme HsdR N-terminal domain-containing protein [Peptostreptococcus sp. CBA3647]
MSKELVKERVVEYLIKELNVPEDMIEIDTPLSEYEEGVEGTLDITVVALDEDDCLLPLMVIHCLDDDIDLDEQVVEGQMDFLELIDETTHVGRMILTNGDQMMYADWNGTELEDEEALPTYDKMIEEYKATEKEYKDYVAEHPDYLEEHDHDHDNHHEN